MAEPILIGTRGWDFPEWAGRFYPDELPADWRFCYYSNQLRAVLVPGDTWDVVDRCQVRQWVEDGDPAFRFVLELPPALSLPAVHQRMQTQLTEFFKTIEPIRTLTAGLILRVPAHIAPDHPWLADLLHLLEHAPAVCVDLPATWRDTAPVLADRGIGACWHTAHSPAPETGGKFMVALCQETAPKSQRRVLEQLAHWRGEHGAAALFFDAGAANPPESAKQARTVAELMGI